MRFFLLLLILSGTAFGQGTVSSTCIWSGTVARCLPSAGLLLDGQKDLRLGEATANGTDYIALQSPALLANNYTLTLPDTVGSSGQFMTHGGTGVMSWTFVADANVDAAAAISGSKLQAAGVSNAGAITAGTQTIGGTKTLNDILTVTGGVITTNGSVSITTSPVTTVSLSGYTPGVYLYTISAAGSTASYGSAIVVKSTAITYAVSTILVSGGTISLSGSDVQYQRSSGGSVTHRWTMLLLNPL